jgi:hypothetical protein
LLKKKLRPNACGQLVRKALESMRGRTGLKTMSESPSEPGVVDGAGTPGTCACAKLHPRRRKRIIGNACRPVDRSISVLLIRNVPRPHVIA